MIKPARMAPKLVDARTACPGCGSGEIKSLDAMSIDGWVDYFRCDACHQAWCLPKHQNEPVRIVANGQPARMQRPA